MAGVSALDFWRMLPCEVYAAIAAANMRAKGELKRTLYLAWYTAALTRAKRMPGLKRLLKDDAAQPDFEQLKRDHEEILKHSKMTNVKE